MPPAVSAQIRPVKGFFLIWRILLWAMGYLASPILYQTGSPASGPSPKTSMPWLPPAKKRPRPSPQMLLKRLCAPSGTPGRGLTRRLLRQSSRPVSLPSQRLSSTSRKIRQMTLSICIAALSPASEKV